jgi:LPXTG-motif cell wall-anchored protein
MVRVRTLKWWRSSVVAVLISIIGLPGAAHPAPQLEPSVPVWSIISMGEAVASRDTLTIGTVELAMGGPERAADFKFIFEPRDVGVPLVSFLDRQSDPACAPKGTAAPFLALECSYSRQITPGKTVDFDFAHRISRPVYHGTGNKPLIKVTIVTDMGTSSAHVFANRVRPEADFVVTIDGPISGRVGDVVDVKWTVTNVGLDPVWGHDSAIELIAPAGTAWVDVPPEKCGPPVVPGTKYRCGLGIVQPGAANAHKQIWHLTILSESVGQGRIAASMFNATGIVPDDDFVDPTPANNVAVALIDVNTPTTSSPGGGQAGGDLPVTGTSTGLLLAAGAVTVVTGTFVLLISRRRRIEG